MTEQQSKPIEQSAIDVSRSRLLQLPLIILKMEWAEKKCFYSRIEWIGRGGQGPSKRLHVPDADSCERPLAICKKSEERYKARRFFGDRGSDATKSKAQRSSLPSTPTTWVGDKKMS